MELNEFFKLAVKSLNYHCFIDKHCINDKWTLREREEDVPKPKIDNWARHRMSVEYQYKKIDLFTTPIKEENEPKSTKRRKTKEKFKRLGEDDPESLGNLKRFDTMEKFEIDGIIDTRFYKGLIQLQDRAENLTEDEIRIESKI